MDTTGPQKITTFLMFHGDAEEAMTFYTSLFDDSRILSVDRYGAGESGAEGTVRHAAFSLAGQRLACIDSSVKHDFTFTPAISLYVRCGTEAEIDRLYAALSEKGAELMPLGDYGFSAKYGWVVDRFGVAWQLDLVPES
ncbi:VOC family protein [Microtetraspora fusca]|uniref:VOC family protein n=1 Tax=Microtetraspora fusca TaxID=1997 RepID=UPI00082F0EB5|nr:VOC family protein [Microtetraspora fusca]